MYNDRHTCEDCKYCLEKNGEYYCFRFPVWKRVRRFHYCGELEVKKDE